MRQPITALVDDDGPNIRYSFVDTHSVEGPELVVHVAIDPPDSPLARPDGSVTIGKRGEWVVIWTTQHPSPVNVGRHLNGPVTYEVVTVGYLPGIGIKIRDGATDVGEVYINPNDLRAQGVGAGVFDPQDESYVYYGVAALDQRP